MFFLFQAKQWPQYEQQVWQPITFHPNTQTYHDWRQQAINNQSFNVMQQAVPNPVSKQLPTKTFTPNPQARSTCKLHTIYVQFNHLVYLGCMKYNYFFVPLFAVVPNTGGGYKAAIIKRKRKRTMFTTEQIQTLESFFKNKPYITREERQIFVDNLHISDCAVKVWFQNRRLREKREREEREAEALELANSYPEGTLCYSQNNMNFETSTPALAAHASDLSNYFRVASFDANPVTGSAMELENSNTTKEFDIDHLLNDTYVKLTEGLTNKISQNFEDSGVDSDSSRITSDSLSSEAIDSNTTHLEKVDIVETTQNTTAIINTNEASNSPSLDDIEADLKEKTDEFGYVTLDNKAIDDLASVLANVLPSDVDLGTLSVPEEMAEDSDSTIYAGSIYEPISPVVSDVDEETLKTKWEPFAPEKSLQKLFDLHFC